MFFTTIYAVLSIFTAVATILPIFPYENWKLRIFDFPRLQIAGLGILGISLNIFNPYGLISWTLLIITSAATLLQIIQIFPYTPFFKKRVKYSPSEDPEKQVSLLVCNVFMDNKSYEKVLDVIKKFDPDIVLIVEPDKKWETGLAPLKNDYPYHYLKAMDNTYGMMLYSRLRLKDAEFRHLIEEDIPSFKAKVELRSGDYIDLYGIHPKPPAPNEAKSSVPRDAELVLVGKEIKKSGQASIIAGDLNDVGWSHTSRMFRRLSGMLDPRQGRGLFPTFNVKYRLLRWPLDHIFHSSEFRLKKLERLPDVGSDHFPIYICLSYEPEKKHKQPEPQPNSSDHADAQEKLEKAGEI